MFHYINVVFKYIHIPPAAALAAFLQKLASVLLKLSRLSQIEKTLIDVLKP